MKRACAIDDRSIVLQFPTSGNGIDDRDSKHDQTEYYGFDVNPSLSFLL